MKTLIALALIALPLAARAADHRSEAEGWAISLPDGWKSGVRDGRLFLGSDTEAGLLVVWFDASSTRATLEEAARSTTEMEGLTLRPAGKPQRATAKGGEGLAVDLEGSGPDGVPIRGRVVGILGPRGAVAVVGLTSAEHIAKLARTVNKMAKSIRFEKPAAGDLSKLREQLCSYSGGSGASTTRRMSFDGRGGVGYGSQTVASGNFNDGMGNQTGSWGAVSGDGAARAPGRYTISDDRVVIQVNGGTRNCTVHMRQRDGRITELKCGDQLWASTLCD